MRSPCFARLCRATLSGVLLIVVTGLAPALAPAQTQAPPPPGTPASHLHGFTPLDFPTGEDNVTVRPDGTKLSPQQKRLITRANFEMSKNDAAELAALAKGLREVLDKPNTNIHSLEVNNRIDKIQKLAKKIREETTGY